MIPLLHDFVGQAVLVFGGGPVGARKARRFAREARVLVVSPAFVDNDFGDSERVRAAPTPADITDWFERADPALAVAATDDEAVNDAVARAAREHGCLLNRADRSGGSDGGQHDVVVPATVRDDPVVLAVATGGASPALSRYLRERFEEEFAGAGAMATLTGGLREQLRADTPPAARRAAIRAVVRSERVWKALGDGTHNPAQEAQSVISDVLSEGNEP
ncbi:precorrin-2 dehydrogenase/sirohydrochlorin ferrochelatase family protein [Halococcus sp. AFM35]|uniref:precorrin-2 dehydrogenase/sirohydrochlorin ferrochelatase family protein n=1 Tax=Halococcus sp. AFM35 TaxID=3421653 RepID=UPI003EBD7757